MTEIEALIGKGKKQISMAQAEVSQFAPTRAQTRITLPAGRVLQTRASAIPSRKAFQRS